MRAWIVLGLVASRPAFADPELYENTAVDAGVTFVRSAISDRYGDGLAVEIRGLVDDHLAIGGRVEIGAMYGGVVGSDRASLDIAFAASGIAKAEYLFGTGLVRPFVGGGVGGYTIGAQSIPAGPDRAAIETAAGRYIGAALQVGVDLGPVRVAATYNAMLGATLEVHETVGTGTQTVQLSQNYLTLELAYRFVGGRKAH